MTAHQEFEPQDPIIETTDIPSLFFSWVDYTAKTEKFLKSNENALKNIEIKDILHNLAASVAKYWQNSFAPIIKYVTDWEEWVVYQAGVYRRLHKNEINKILSNLLKEFNKICEERRVPIKKRPKNTIHKRKEAKEIIKLEFSAYLKEFDDDTNILNVKNGLLYLDTLELKPHAPTHLSLVQLNVNYLDIDVETPLWDSLKALYPEAFIKIEYFIRSVIYKNMSDELALFIFGRRNSGKGSALGVIEKIFIDTSSTDSLHEIGERFGLQHLVGKLVNIKKETEIAQLSSRALMNFKSITGRDGRMTVEEKGKNKYEVVFDPFFFISAGNLAFTLPHTDQGAFLRRTLIAEMNKKPEHSYKNFKEDILLESDAIFSHLAKLGYYSWYLIDGVDFNQDEFVEENKKLWDKWTDPIAMICEDVFEVTSPTIDDSAIISSKQLKKFVELKLKNFGFQTNFSAFAISKYVNKFMKEMDIMERHSADFYYYQGIRVKEEFREQFDAIDN